MPVFSSKTPADPSGKLKNRGSGRFPLVSALAQRVRHGLNEARILILGAQVMLGFHFRAPLEAGYEQLTSTAIAVQLGGLLLLLVAVALTVALQVAERPGAIPRRPALTSVTFSTVQAAVR